MKKINNDILREKYLNILDFFDNFCDQHNLNYSLAYGSLLGAVRHNGFIPWDDDVDVFMPRQDYEELIRIFDNNSTYKLTHYTKTPNIISRMAYIVDSKTCRKSTYAKEFVDGLGINIDIFPVDDVPNNVFLRFIQYKRIKFWDNMFTIKMLQLSPYRKKIKNFLIKILKIITIPFSNVFVERHIDKLCKKYSIKGEKYLYCKSFLSPYNQKLYFHKTNFLNREKVNFENKKYYISKEYDEILTKTYGDYMKFPPIDKRLPHNDHMEYFEI